MSLRRIDELIKTLRDGTYRWPPVKRKYIPKKDGRKRPIGQPNWTDKLLQEVIRMLLSAYYEPQFSEHSHGFRPNQGCHTALRDIEWNFKGVAWFIEGDIEGCFDNIKHEVLMRILSQNIHDNRFLELVQGLLKAGYMEEWEFHKTYSGTPQGGVLSPLLTNIYLNELDKFIEDELLAHYNRGHSRRPNPEYQRLNEHMHYRYRKGKIKEALEIRKQLRQIPRRDPTDPEYRKLRYVRYADDFILGYAGTKSEAKEIRRAIGDFLASLGLQLSYEKTRITHVRTEKAQFLRYDILVRHNNTKMSKASNGVKTRSINGGIHFSVPREVIRSFAQRYMRHGKPIHLSSFIVDSDYSIVALFQARYRGLAQYYALAHDRSRKFSWLKWIMSKSLAATLAAKHDTSGAQIFKRYKATVTNKDGSYQVLQVTVEREGKKPLIAIWGGISLKRQSNAKLVDKINAYQIWSKRTELVERLLADTCEFCGSQERVQVHHIRALKDINRPGRRPKTPAEVRMITRQRKTLVVCWDCHHKIHQGRL